MRISPLVPSLFLCLFLLGGCAAHTAPKAPTARFPESPVGALAKTPAQGMPAQVRKSAATASGGWGYKQADAFILAPPPGYRGKSYNTITLEKKLIHARNDVEFSDTPTDGQRYVVVDYGTVSRTISSQNGRMYAVWRGQVCLLSEAESPALYQQLTGCPLPRRAPLAAAAATRSVPREYWFDVSRTFNRQAKGAGSAWNNPW